MRVIVVGAGKVGFEIAHRLSGEGHDVVVVDKDPEALREIADHLDVMTVTGNGASPRLLEEVGVAKTDVMIAVTETDEVNMIACMAAKRYGVRTCVARIRNPEYTANKPQVLSLKDLGIDIVIDPERLAALEMARLLESPTATEVDLFANDQILVVGYDVGLDAPVAGRTLREIDLPNLLIVALLRGEEVIIPKGDDRIAAGDQLFVLGKKGDLDAIRPLLGLEEMRIRRVAIIGGSRIGVNLATALLSGGTRELQITLVEKDPQRARQVAEALPGALVVEGDGTKIDVLREEGIPECDALVAAAGEDHTNLLSTMLAKRLGVPEVITEISREDYVPLARRAGADAVVVPRLLTVGTVLRLVRRSEIVSLTILHEGKAEVVEFRAAEDSPVVHKPLHAVRFPSGAIVGAVMHDGQATIAHGATVIRPGDHVIVFTLPEVVPRLEALFRSRKEPKVQIP